MSKAIELPVWDAPQLSMATPDAPSFVYLDAAVRQRAPKGRSFADRNGEVADMSIKVIRWYGGVWRCSSVGVEMVSMHLLRMYPCTDEW